MYQHENKTIFIKWKYTPDTTPIMYTVPACCPLVNYNKPYLSANLSTGTELEPNPLSE